ncbi:P-selectin-like [Strongylocentrotus purpuratus]|uniref:Uncharacterized protein n=1 Tax=Strongylocentrotus purpuratus TaxID=7668 RepID=A0A7M7N9X7_STRPU|nr:P-selectin-like [Strongylocentrotus purpuratus]
MKSSSFQYIFVVIHVVTSSHYICLISATCAMPDPIPNTITTLPNQTLETGYYITWECSDGYMMDGLTNTVVWVCLEDGSWLGHIPICKDVECPSPPIAAYSELDPPLPEAPVVNQTISYRCSSSEYTLLGSYLNRCLRDGIWENDPPVCQRTCSTFNTKRYSNLTCYRRRGSEEWDGSFDLCIDQGEILATVKDAQTQEFLVDFLRTFNGGDNIWIGAREGRDWKWRKNDKYIERFFWQNPFPDSNLRDCIELSYQSGSTKYSWNPRSLLEENALLCQYDQSCQSVGLSQSDMVLEYMDTCFQFLDVSRNCDDGAEECNGRGGFLAEILDESTNALLLDRALYLRDLGVNTAWWIGGYDENSGRSWYWSDKTRLNYEEWNDDQPNNVDQDQDCVEMRSGFQYRWNDQSCSDQIRTLCQIGIPACGDPGEPLHGNRLPDDRTTYSVSATLHFTCQEGYTLSGENVLRCMNNGAWNHQRPSCEAVECEGSPPQVVNASTLILGSDYQDIAVYTCQDGYIPDQEPISFCQHTGNWSIPNFTCSG